MTDEVESTEGAEESDLPEGEEDTLRAKYGHIITLSHPGLGGFAFKRASQPVYEKMLNQMSDDKQGKAEAARSFSQHCLCWPQKDDGSPDYKAVQNLFLDCPGLASELAGELRELANGGVTLKKR